MERTLIFILNQDENNGDIPQKQVYKEVTDWKEDTDHLVILFQGESARIQLSRIDSYFPLQED